MTLIAKNNHLLLEPLKKVRQTTTNLIKAYFLKTDFINVSDVISSVHFNALIIERGSILASLYDEYPNHCLPKWRPNLNFSSIMSQNGQTQYFKVCPTILGHNT